VYEKKKKRNGKTANKNPNCAETRGKGYLAEAAYCPYSAGDVGQAAP